MSIEGRITGWKDDRGYGFIAPTSGGDQPFVHISSFVNRHRRPQENELVTYALSRDKKGRLRAVKVKFADDATRHVPTSQAVVRSILVAVTFLSIVGIAVAAGVLSLVILMMVIAMSLVAFAMYWYDKSAARTNRWRTRESTLLVVGLAGGWPGALVAMQVFRHKSSKKTFRNVFWVTVLANCGALVWSATPSGAGFLSSALGVS